MHDARRNWSRRSARCPASARRSPPSPPRPTTSARRTSRAPTAARRPARASRSPLPDPAAPAAEPHRQGPEVGRVRAADRRAGPGQLAARGRAHRPAAAPTTPTRRRRRTTRQERRQGQAGHHAEDPGRRGVRRQGRRRRHAGDVGKTYDSDSSTYWRTDELHRRSGLRTRVQARRGHRLRPRLGPGGIGSVDRAPFRRGPHDGRRCTPTGLADVRRTLVDGSMTKIGTVTTTGTTVEGDGRQAGEDAVRAGLVHRRCRTQPATATAAPATSRPSRT